MTETRADLVVLGGGSGGYAAALRAAELGRSVILIERDRVGGTCLHRGCIPTKALLHAAEVADTVRDAHAVGVTATLDSVDADAVASYRDGIVAKKFAGLKGLLSARGITVVSGEGRLLPDLVVAVGEDRYRAEDIVLATGAVSRMAADLRAGGRILSSDEALRLVEIPRRVIILGGGVIGVEFASLWRSLGAEVTVIEALDHLVANEDIALSKALERAFRKRKISVRLGVRFASAEQSEQSVTVTLEDGTTLTADYLLVAVGRAPLTAELGLEEAGVGVTDGFVDVDEHLQTTAEHVWAVGDIVRGLQLAHRGFAQGIFVAESIAGTDPTPVPDTTIPRITYSRPELASVGVTEQQARAEYGERVAAFEYNLAGNAKSEIIGTGGIVKVVRLVDGPVIGVHLAGDRVGELITEAQLAIGWDAHPEDIAPFLHAHPTQSEALGEAFLALAGKPLHAL